MHPGSKCNILGTTESQEIVRRLHNTSDELGYRVKEEIIEKFILKMRLSGYKRRQIRDIVRRGIMTYRNKWAPRTDRHRNSADTEESRREKKLTGKTSWFRKRHTHTVNTQRPRAQSSKKAAHKHIGAKPLCERRPNTVLFVDRTRGGHLITELRKQEAEVNKFSTRKVKLV